MFTTSRLVYSILLFVIMMLILLVSRPHPVFDEFGGVTPFGVGDRDKTLCSLGITTAFLAIVSFYGFAVIDLAFGP